MTCLNPMCQPLTTAAPVDTYPGTGFDSRPTFIPNNVIIPTLDDVPDGTNTGMAKMPGHWATADLQYLDLNRMHWDFFINTDNACGDITAASPDMQCIAAVQDILSLHNPANHTVHHWHLGTPGAMGCGDAACVDSEITGVETEINTLSNGDRPHLTRFRAPFGEPYQAGTFVQWVQPEVAKYAVSVGWNLDSTDSLYDDGTNCTQLNSSTLAPCPTGQDIANAVISQIGTPGTGQAYGIVLMHGIFGWTHDAIRILFDPATGYVQQHGFKVGTVEDAICWKYGKHSWEIVQQLTGQARAPN
jgi:peptidoglycan/xylan/chitin deacetylase (PgdA/CDA1 family)